VRSYFRGNAKFEFEKHAALTRCISEASHDRFPQFRGRGVGVVESVDVMSGNLLTCLFCGAVVDPPRKTGDHIIPRSLGLFQPDLALMCVCRTCDGQHGGTFEKSISSDSIIGFIRWPLNIHGDKKLKKGRRPKDPLSWMMDGNEPRSLEQKEFAVSVIDGRPVQFTEKVLRIGDHIAHNGGYKLIAPSDTAEEICDQFASLSGEVRLILNNDSGRLDAVCKEMQKRGITATRTPREEYSHVKLRMQIPVTLDFHRFVANILLKTMYSCGYSRELLVPIGHFVHTAEQPGIESRALYGFGMRDSILNEENALMFCHVLSWRIPPTVADRVQVSVRLFAHGAMGGIGIDTDLPLGRGFIPFDHGRIEAHYADRRIHVYKGDEEITDNLCLT